MKPDTQINLIIRHNEEMATHIASAPLGIYTIQRIGIENPTIEDKLEMCHSCELYHESVQIYIDTIQDNLKALKKLNKQKRSAAEWEKKTMGRK
jgi:hypothetical protein